jgi:hypothetical protein
MLKIAKTSESEKIQGPWCVQEALQGFTLGNLRRQGKDPMAQAKITS